MLKIRSMAKFWKGHALRFIEKVKCDEGKKIAAKVDLSKVKKVRYYDNNGEITDNEQIEKCGLKKDDYMSLDECAYQHTYDESEEWSKDPKWEYVENAYKQGFLDALKHIEETFKIDLYGEEK